MFDEGVVATSAEELLEIKMEALKGIRILNMEIKR